MGSDGSPGFNSDVLVLHPSGSDFESGCSRSGSSSSVEDGTSVSFRERERSTGAGEDPLPSKLLPTAELLSLVEAFQPDAVEQRVVSHSQLPLSASQMAGGMSEKEERVRFFRPSPNLLWSSHEAASANQISGRKLAELSKLRVPPLPALLPSYPDPSLAGQFRLTAAPLRHASMVELPAGTFSPFAPSPSLEDWRLLGRQAGPHLESSLSATLPFRAVSQLESLSRQGLLYASASEQLLRTLLSILGSPSGTSDPPSFADSPKVWEAVTHCTRALASSMEQETRALARLQYSLLLSRREALLADCTSLDPAVKNRLRVLPVLEDSLFGTYVSEALAQVAQRNLSDRLIGPSAPTPGSSASKKSKSRKRKASATVTSAAPSAPKQARRVQLKHRGRGRSQGDLRSRLGRKSGKSGSHSKANPQ